MTFFQKWPFLQHQGITHGFGSKREIFPSFFFSGNTGQENVYYDINSWTKKRLSRLKKKDFQKSRKIEILVLVHGFGPKMAIFPTLFFRHYRPGKCLLRYSRTKKPFLGYKNKKFKKSKDWHFSKGDNPWFSSKNDHFSNFLFTAI